ncbi:MAG TPA: radical SAM protein [Candidatus Omnitrophota bacterium]|nr:radical SAM protein [Candidatus Omnitrophota bacterium]HPT07749.1 radical SAM protein [Candidatus Omnitrophota bacterium]
MMKILLLNPPYCMPGDNPDTILKKGFFLPPLGLASIAAYLKKNGMQVRLMDLFNWDWKRVEALVQNDDSDIIGITCVTNQHMNSRYLAEMFKHGPRKPLVVFGGPHATHLDEQVAMNFPLDYVVRGEGEVTFLELIRCLEAKEQPHQVPGLTFKEGETVFKTPERDLIDDLDDLPFPCYDDLDMREYIPYLTYEPFLGSGNTGKITYPLLTARGCPNRCNFCSCPLLWAKKVRLRSPGSVIQELISLKAKGAEHIQISDDTFLLNLERVNEISRSIIKNNLQISWTAAGRVNPVSVETLSLMKKAGCARICFGVESGSKRILTNINKNITIDQITNAFDISRKSGLENLAFIMIGNTGETSATVQETIDVLKKCNADDVIIGITQLFPGTDLEKYATHKGYITDDYWLHNRFAPLFDQELDAVTLSLYADKVLFSDYMRKKHYIKALRVFINSGLKSILHMTGTYALARSIKNRLRASAILAGIKKYGISMHSCQTWREFLQRINDRSYIIASFIFARLCNKPLIQVAGDSHIFTFKNKFPFIVHFLGSATMYNLNKEKSSTRSNEKLFAIARRINTKRDILMLVFGEIDCRIHIYNQFEKNNRKYSIPQLIQTTIAHYAQVLEKLTNQGIPFCVYGIPPASRQENFYKYPYYASMEERSKINKEFNTALKDFCKDKGYPYIDIYAYVTDENGFAKIEYLLPDTVHLKSSIAAFVDHAISRRIKHTH